jgi:hypothetical protein
MRLGPQHDIEGGDMIGDFSAMILKDAPGLRAGSRSLAAA